MEREVFERGEAAEVLNRGFISIKVDREERPDVDQLYMNSCVELTGSGGWPLTVFMTPDKEPFFAGTYFPLTAFLSIAGQVSGLWKEDRQRLHQAASAVLTAMEQKTTAALQNREELPHIAVRQLKASFDSRCGGFGKAPKFPSPHTLLFLQRYALCYQDKEAGDMARFTLRRMSLGGLRDHVGGGFFRYATDRRYLIPHFEKMLYDNAMLAIAYAEQGFAAEAHEIFRFCERELQSAEGAYFTALDADSEGEEGKYYLFTPSDIERALGEHDAKRYGSLYDITQQGNFEGKSLPNLLNTNTLSQDEKAFAAACHQKLMNMRSERVRPLCDEKILLSSNALMLAALATCGRLLQTPAYIQKAVSLADFLRHSMRRNGRLYASYRVRLSAHPATSDDYAYLAWGLYRLYQATMDGRWLKASAEVCDEMLCLFESGEGLLWLSGSDVLDLPMRVQHTQDGALPCGNGIAAGVLLRLHTVTTEERYLAAYRKLAESLAAQAEEYPAAYTSFLSALLLEEHGQHVEIPLRNNDLRLVAEEFHPFASFVPAKADTAAVCTGQACLPPIGSAEGLREAIGFQG